MSDSKIQKKFIRFGTGNKEVNSRDLPAYYTPINYTPDEISSEGDDKVSAHLKGIDLAIGNLGPSGDITETSFSASNNQTTPVDVTNFLFPNLDIRSFQALVSVNVDSDSELNEEFILNGIQKNASWEMSTESVGDDSGIQFSLNSSGQIQYLSANYSGFNSATIKFRAIVTNI